MAEEYHIQIQRSVLTAVGQNLGLTPEEREAARGLFLENQLKPYLTMMLSNTVDKITLEIL